MTSDIHSAAPDAAAQTGEAAFGHYRILELIGAGGMAEVYRAISLGPGGFQKPVVIKRVKPKHSGDPSFVRMFVDEAKLSAQLQHPNIVTVFEFGEIEGHNYIAMEYIDGLHLQAAHVRHMQLHQQPLPWQVCLLMARDILSGLDYAHNKEGVDGGPLGLVHRDINLVNVMVGRGGVVKILDFGIVKAAGGIRSAETVGGVLKGKFGYMSPEQAEGRALDRRSDVFSVAIVLHELFTGRRLFWGEDDLVILRKVCGGEIVDPRVYRPEIPAMAAEVTMRGLARDLGERYPSAGAMADALDEVIAANRISDGTLRALMEELLPSEVTEASEEMRRKRRKITLMAWASGVRDMPAPDRLVSGVLAPRDNQATASGKPLGTPGAAMAGSGDEGTLITAEPRWLAPEGEVEGVEIPLVLGEQDTTVVTEAAVGDPSLDEATRILLGEEVEGRGADSEEPRPGGGSPTRLLLAVALLAVLAGLVIYLMVFR